MTVNFRTHYRERQDARDLPRLEDLSDLVGPRRAMAVRRWLGPLDPEARREAVLAHQRTKLHQPGADPHP